MSREKKLKKQEAKRQASTRQLIGAKEITDYSLVTYGQGEIGVFYREADQHLRALPGQRGGKDLCADDGTKRRSGN